MIPTQLNLGVVVRTCGRSPFFLRRALNSVISQTVLPALIVVVDDSADAAQTKAGLARIDFRGIRLVFLPRDLPTQPQPNRSTALNRGIASADTRWVSFLDDDDTWTPQFLERVAHVLVAHENRQDFGGVVTQSLLLCEQQSPDGYAEKKRKLFNPELKAVELAALVAGNRFTLNAMVVRRDVFSAVGPYREDLPVLEDWEFNVRAAIRFHFEVIPEPLACYHQRPAGEATANTPIDEHIRVGARIRNEWLRADLAAGRIGLGQLATTGEIRDALREIRSLVGLLGFVRRWRDKLFGWFGRSAQ